MPGTEPDAHLPRRRIRKHEQILPRRNLRDASCPNSVRRQVRRIHAPHRLRKLDLHRIQRRHDRPRFRQHHRHHRCLQVLLGHQGRPEHEVAARQVHVENLHRQHVLTGSQRRTHIAHRIVQVRHRLRCRRQGRRQDPHLTLGHVVPGNFLTVDPRHESVIARHPQQRVLHVRRGGEVEPDPREVRGVLVLHVRDQRPAQSLPVRQRQQPNRPRPIVVPRPAPRRRVRRRRLGLPRPHPPGRRCRHQLNRCTQHSPCSGEDGSQHDQPPSQPSLQVHAHASGSNSTHSARKQTSSRGRPVPRLCCRRWTQPSQSRRFAKPPSLGGCGFAPLRWGECPHEPVQSPRSRAASNWET